MRALLEQISRDLGIPMYGPNGMIAAHNNLVARGVIEYDAKSGRWCCGCRDCRRKRGET